MQNIVLAGSSMILDSARVMIVAMSKIDSFVAG